MFILWIFFSFVCLNSCAVFRHMCLKIAAYFRHRFECLQYAAFFPLHESKNDTATFGFFEMTRCQLEEQHFLFFMIYGCLLFTHPLKEFMVL